VNSPRRPLTSFSRSLVLGALTCAGLSGCGGPDFKPLPPPRHLRKARPQVAQDPPESAMAPVDRWRKRLRRLLPAPWKVQAIDQQIVAPAGRSRISGGRGLRIVISDQAGEAQVFWVFPRDWRGRVQSKAPARKVLTDETYVLFTDAKDAPGWKSTGEVQIALGITN